MHTKTNTAWSSLKLQCLTLCTKSQVHTLHKSHTEWPQHKVKTLCAQEGRVMGKTRVHKKARWQAMHNTALKATSSCTTQPSRHASRKQTKQNQNRMHQKKRRRKVWKLQNTVINEYRNEQLRQTMHAENKPNKSSVFEPFSHATILCLVSEPFSHATILCLVSEPFSHATILCSLSEPFRHATILCSVSEPFSHAIILQPCHNPVFIVWTLQPCHNPVFTVWTIQPCHNPVFSVWTLQPCPNHMFIV